MKIDGVEMESGDRVLIYNAKPKWWRWRRRRAWRRTRSQNGIYVVTATSRSHPTKKNTSS